MSVRPPLRAALVVTAALAVLAARAVDQEAKDAPALIDRPGLGIALPEGFHGVVFAKDAGAGRGVAISSDGVVFVKDRYPRAPNARGFTGWLAPRQAITAYRDTDGDGVADARARFAGYEGSALTIWRDAQGVEWLYGGGLRAVYRWRLTPGGLAPQGPRERVVYGFPRQGEHPYKAIAISDEGDLFVSVGAPSNSCQKKNREVGSLGIDPCPQRDRGAGVWRFDAAKPNQHFRDGEHWAFGVRNPLDFDWSARHGALYGTSHGRDRLGPFFPGMFTEVENAELPSEELQKIEKGADYGWPYTYYDHLRGEVMLAPEYGGDGKTPAPDHDREPVVGFPGHWAPGDVALSEAATTSNFPERYRNGVFAAFRGGWGRTPLPQGGFRVAFVPLGDDGWASGPWETFADGFAGVQAVNHLRETRFRPQGLAFAPDGALFVSDENRGWVWRIIYTGEPDLTPAERDERAIAALPTPGPGGVEAIGQTAKRSGVPIAALRIGADAYASHCGDCHAIDGTGVPGLQPPLRGSKLVAGEPQPLARLVLAGQASGRWSNEMPGFADAGLDDETLAAILTYIRAAFVERPPEPVSADDIAKARAALPRR